MDYSVIPFIDSYKGDSYPFLLNHNNTFILDKFDGSIIIDDESNIKNSSIELKQLRFFIRLCILQMNSKESENLTNEIPNFNDNLLIDQFFTTLANIIDENLNQQNIFIAFRIISLLSNNKQFYSNMILLDILKLIISNISLLTKKQINQLNFNFILKIIRHNYKREITREIIQSLFPIEFILLHFSDLFNSFFSKYGLQWLKYLNTFCTYDHSEDDGILIFEEISKLKDKVKIVYQLKYFCNILVNMIRFKTLPSEKFISYKYHLFLQKLILNKSNKGILEHALYLIGLCTLNNIILGFFNVNFFISIFNEYPFDDHIRIMVLWNLSISLSDEICHFLIETEFLDSLVIIYQKCSFKLKHEIVSLITDMMCITTDPPSIFLSNNILEILINSMMIFDDNDIFKTSVILYQTIENYIIEIQNDEELIENLKAFLMDSNFIEIIERLDENEDLLYNNLSIQFKEFFNLDEFSEV